MLFQGVLPKFLFEIAKGQFEKNAPLPILQQILFVRNIFSGISFPPMESVDQQVRQQKEVTRT